MSERKVSRLWLHIGPVCTCSARRRSALVRLAVLNWSLLIPRLCTCQSYQPKHRRYLRRPTPLLAPECHPRNRPDQCVAIQTRILVIYPKHSVNFQKIVQILVQIPYCAFFLKTMRRWFLSAKDTHTHTEPDHCRRSKNKSPLIASVELTVYYMIARFDPRCENGTRWHSTVSPGGQHRRLEAATFGKNH